MDKCKICDVILVPEPRIEDLIGEKLPICMNCFIKTIEKLERLEQ